jgi:hypothetical protein
MGITCSSKNNKKFIDPPYLIDKFAVAYLYLHPEIQN